MARRAHREVDRLLQELLPEPPMTDEVLVARIVDMLGVVAGTLIATIEGAASAEEAFARLTEAKVGKQLYAAATAVNHAKRALALRALTRRGGA